jgi:hypothetical protein
MTHNWTPEELAAIRQAQQAAAKALDDDIRIRAERQKAMSRPIEEQDGGEKAETQDDRPPQA